MVGVLLVLGMAMGVSCSSTPTFDRARAVDRVLARSGGGISRGQAECYVDKVTRDIGTDALETDDPEPEKIAQLTRIRIDCIGLANLGTSAPTSATVTTVPGDAGLTVPRGPGDDPQLDQLHAACGAGNGTACDQLFELAALGSAYEEFAGTCGGRTREISCGAVYPGPSIVLSGTSTSSTATTATTASAGR